MSYLGARASLLMATDVPVKHSSGNHSRPITSCVSLRRPSVSQIVFEQIDKVICTETVESGCRQSSLEEKQDLSGSKSSLVEACKVSMQKGQTFSLC